jgi:hypothetical protein
MPRGKPKNELPKALLEILTKARVKEIMAMDRRKRYQVLRNIQGLCRTCGKNPVRHAGAKQCAGCLGSDRERKESRATRGPQRIPMRVYEA